MDAEIEEYLWSVNLLENTQLINDRDEVLTTGQMYYHYARLIRGHDLQESQKYSV